MNEHTTSCVVIYVEKYQESYMNITNYLILIVIKIYVLLYINIYYIFINIHCETTAINKWNAELCDILPNDLCVRDVFEICFSTTNNSTINWLQYRILHTILPVKYYLKKIRITTSDNCTFCNDMPETIKHVFATCKKKN